MDFHKWIRSICVCLSLPIFLCHLSKLEELPKMDISLSRNKIRVIQITFLSISMGH